MKKATDYWQKRAVEAEKALKKAVRETNPLTDWFRRRHPEVYRQGIAEILDQIDKKHPESDQKKLKVV